MSVNEKNLHMEALLPEISGQVQQTTSEELKRWIKEGKLKPTHQVRLKNLPWVDAQNVPAFKSLFESKKNETETKSDNSPNQTFFNSPVYESLKAKLNEKSELSGKVNSLNGNNQSKKEKDEPAAKSNSKSAEPSIAFKLFEKKGQGKSQLTDSPAGQNESNIVSIGYQSEPFQNNAKPQKKSSFARKAAGFLAGCLLVFLLSAGGSYVWVYQLKEAAVIDEKNLPELSNLADKLTSDKLELRLKAAEKERELKTGGGQQEQTAPGLNVSQEIARLENQYKIQRKNLVEEHRGKLRTADFNTTFYFSFAVLLGLFLFVKVFFGKTAETVNYQYSPQMPQNQTPESSDDPAADVQENEPENEPENETTETAQAQQTKIVYKIKSSKESVETEDSEEEVPAELFNCFLHDDKPSDFVCEDCAKFFCRECTVEGEQQENCCFFCKAVCKRVEFEETPPPSKAKQKKPKNLLELGKNKNFVVRWFPEKRTNRVGIIPAFLISALFSSAISILWVYKISPYLENRGKEISQTVAPDGTEPPDKNGGTGTLPQLSNKKAETNSVNNAENGANEPCIDPQTRQPFECDEETRRALHDHTQKIKSVEKAQKETKEKTELILSPFLPAENSESEDANQKTPNPVDEARREFEKQQFIRVFIYSFLTIFGLLMSTWLFGKDEKAGQKS